jgi:hypothetical protein
MRLESGDSIAGKGGVVVGQAKRELGSICGCVAGLRQYFAAWILD